MEYLILILIIIIIIMFFIIRNLYRTKKMCISLIDSYEMVYVDLIKRLLESDKKLKIIDKKGTFESDDEIGWFFTSIKKIQIILNEFSSNVLTVNPKLKNKINARN